MKQKIIRIIVGIIALKILAIVAVITLPYDYGKTVNTIANTGTTLIIVCAVVWFFLPHIKRGIAYLVNHRED